MPCNYSEYLLEEIPKHMDDYDTSFARIYYHGQISFLQSAANNRSAALRSGWLYYDIIAIKRLPYFDIFVTYFF